MTMSELNWKWSATDMFQYKKKKMLSRVNRNNKIIK